MITIRWILLLIFILYVYPIFLTISKINYYNPTTKIIIIGATSGIGQATAKEFAQRGYTVGITGRRTEKLDSIQKASVSRIHTQYMDIAKPEEAQNNLQKLIQKIGGVDIIILNAATGSRDLLWGEQKKVIDTNILGFVAMASVATDYFLSKGKGHIVGVSSIAGLRGSNASPIYSASKAFVSNYLDGLRLRFRNLNASIAITEIQPGLVGSDIMDQESTWSVVDPTLKNVFSYLRISPERAAIEICNAIENQKNHVYVPKFWQPIAFILKVLPRSFSIT